MSENNGLVLKNYEIDYSFIIKNYLDPKMWQKTWNLFIYKSFIFSLKMTSINVQDEKIYFEIQLEDTLNTTAYRDDWNDCWNENKVTDTVWYSLKIEDVSFLKKRIYSSMVDCIKKLERKKIMASEECQEMVEAMSNEKHILTNIAEEFLDDNGVENDDIRDAYIEVYVDKNQRMEENISNYKDLNRYNALTDLYLIFANVNDDKDLLRKVEVYSLNEEELASTQREIKEYMENLETEGFEEEMKSYLEDI